MKNLLICVCLVFIPLTGFTKTKVRPGIFIAGGFAEWSGADSEKMGEMMELVFEELGLGKASFSQGSRFVYGIGAYFPIRLNSLLVFQPEAQFITKGNKYSESARIVDEDWGDLGTLEMDMTFKSSYLDFPLLIKLSKVSSSSSPCFCVFAGPYFGLQLSSKMAIKVSMEGDSETEEEDFDDLESSDFGYIIGAGLELVSGVSANVRYQQGMKKVIEDMDIFNRVITAQIGFSF